MRFKARLPELPRPDDVLDRPGGPWERGCDELELWRVLVLVRLLD